MSVGSAVATDRRRAPRLRVGLPVELDPGEGWTRDISASGVYFETDVAFAPGMLIAFALVLEYAALAPLRLLCHGQVVRVECRGDRLGVAVAITASRFEREAAESMSA